MHRFIIRIEGKIEGRFRFEAEGEESRSRIPTVVPRDLFVGEKLSVSERGVLFSKLDQLCSELEDFLVLFEFIPEEPIDLIVESVGVIVSLACVPIFISHEEHRNSLRTEKGEEKIAHLSLAQRDDVGIVGGAFMAAIPAVVLVVAVAV